MAKGYGMKGKGKDCKPRMRNKQKAAFLQTKKPASKKNKKPKKS